MRRVVANAFLQITLLAAAPAPAIAHSPHHLVTDVAVASVSESEAHAFILITDQVLKTEQRGGAWRSLNNGLNTRFPFTSIVASPDYAADATVFLASAGDGIYRSVDRGESWQKLPRGPQAADISRLSISQHFAADGRLLAASASGGMWRSLDRGDTWQMVLTEAVEVTSIAEAGHLYAGDGAGRLWRSADNGRLWEIVHEFGGRGAVTGIAAHRDHLFIGTANSGVYRSSDDGRSFSRVLAPEDHGQPICRMGDAERPVSDNHITSIATTPARGGGQQLVATSWYGGVFVSTDGGETWSSWNQGLTCEDQADRMAEPHFGKVESLVLGGQPAYWLGTFDGLFIDHGESWQQQETLPLGLIKGMAVTAGSTQQLAVALSTYGGGFYLSGDYGVSWGVGNRGLLTTRLTGLAFSPEYHDDGVIYAGASRRLLMSSDHGQSWQRIRLDRPTFATRVANKLSNWGLPGDWLRPSHTRSRSPVYPTHIAPLSGRVLIGTRYHGVMAYTPDDDLVETLWSGTDQVVGSLSMSPAFEQDTTLFSSIRGGGIFRSYDGGVTWVAVNNGLPFVSDWAKHPGRGDFRRDSSIALSPAFASDGILFTGSAAGDGLFVSRNRGDSWSRSKADFGVSPAPVLAIAVSPSFADDNSLLISVKGRGLFLSRDRGESVEPVAVELIKDNVSVEYLEYSPGFANDRSIIAASDERLFVSTDGGESWTESQRPVRYEDMRDVVSFSDGWTRKTGEAYSAMSETESRNAGSSVSMRFVGDGIRWIGSKGPACGAAEIVIDDTHVETVSCEAAESLTMQELYSIRGLGGGPHRIEVRAASDAPIGVDAFDVLP